MDYSCWDPISIDGYDAQARRKISLLTAAIKDYIDGHPFSPSLVDDGIYRETLLRHFNRCITPDGSGHVFGWRGLCPGLRVRPNERRKALVQSGHGKRGGLSGALSLFLRQYDHVAGQFEQYLLANARRSTGHEARLRQKSAHQKFIQLCEEAGIQECEWPFCTRRKGRESIRQHVDRFLELRYDDIVGTQFGLRAKARSHTSTGYESRLLACRPFDIVEVDEHKCGFIGSIGIPTPEGVRWFPIERVTIILVVDRWLRLILGYKVIFRREASADDVLDAMNSAVSHEAPRNYCEGYEVSSTIGLPDQVVQSLTQHGFNQVLFDNALIHIATEVSDRARDLIGCDFNFGPVRRFERRATVENVFGGLERLGFCRLQSTVGNSPVDPKRQDAEKAAVKAQLHVKEILDLIESVIVDHNKKGAKSNFGSNPLARLKAARHDVDGIGMIFPSLPPLAPGVAGLDVSVVQLVIRGSKDKGRRPYFTFEGEAYTGIEMARDWSLLDKPVIGHVKRHAISEIRVFSRSGAYIDAAKVMGRWRHTEHSRQLRKHINGLIQDGYLSVGYLDCPVNRYLELISASVRHESTKKLGISKKDLSVVAASQAEHGDQFANEATPPVEESSTDDIQSSDLPGQLAQESLSTEEDEFLDYDELTAFEGVVA
ncbi:hypothetical protein P5Y53_13730 [Dyella jiangningensis]|uniref:hypothetical protein n=1 Tax=Dyella jiangningensis TaxID=1379159 RepID=UPI00240EF532|nr:hypothetical protein [Dyella jiangningensis]MDG2538730.1 hypothetical protein [Dyella jiangningensis]